MEHAEDLSQGREVPRLQFKFFLEAKYPDELCPEPYSADLFAKSDPPRIVKTHLPLRFYKDRLEKSPDIKVIQVIRNPKDSLVSYYHFYRIMMTLGWFNGSWDQFFEMVKEKDLVWGDYFEHI